MDDRQKEINTTRNWGIATLLALLVPSIGFFVWIGGIENKVENNQKDINEIKLQVNSINADIRAILIGVEQVKARLGIVEKEP